MQLDVRHSINEQGELIVDLREFEFIDSVKHRKKFSELCNNLENIGGIKYFCVCLVINSKEKYYLSNMYKWAIPYYIMGFRRSDVDFSPERYAGVEYFFPREIKGDPVQEEIVRIEQEYYKTYDTYTLVRRCPECTLLIATFHDHPVKDLQQIYRSTVHDVEKFTIDFVEDTIDVVNEKSDELRNSRFGKDPSYRKRVITNKISPIVHLSPRQKECLQLSRLGKSKPEIAAILNIGPDTVKTHFKFIFSKLGVSSVQQAVSESERRELI